MRLANLFVRSLVGLFLPPFCVVDLETSNDFDVSCRRAYDAKQTAYRTWCRARSSNHYIRFVLARAEAQRVYGAARESHNEYIRNTLSTLPVHISGGRHLKARSFVRSRLFRLSGGPEKSLYSSGPGCLRMES